MSEITPDDLLEGAVEAAVELAAQAQEDVEGEMFADASYKYSMLSDLSTRIAGDLAAKATNQIRESVFRPEHIAQANGDDEEDSPTDNDSSGSYL